MEKNGEIANTRYLIEENFLPRNAQRRLLDFAVAHMEQFTKAEITNGSAHYRKAIEIRDSSFVKMLLLPRVISKAFHAVRAFNLDCNLVTAMEQIECRLTAYQDGDFFRVHRDNGGVSTANRRLSFVYYFRKSPNSFYGGELRLFKQEFTGRRIFGGGDFDLIPPADNSLIIFNSDLAHEVLPIYVPSQEFHDARFTVNGWFSDKVT